MEKVREEYTEREGAKEREKGRISLKTVWNMRGPVSKRRLWT